MVEIKLIIDCDNSLPVELGKFEAEVTGNDIVLNWVTESEIENLGFEIYSSSTENGNFNLLSSFKTNPYLIGQGNSTIKHTYSYTVKDPENGTYWFKLADITMNDEKTFHEPISITINTKTPQGFQLDPNYPNPFNPTTKISYQVSKERFIDVTVYNLQGQIVSKLVSKKQSPGVYNIDWTAIDINGNKMSSGIYILRLSSGNDVKSRKIMLIR